MENLNQSVKEAVCIDEEVFFGPITEKERKIRDKFETIHRNEFNVLDVPKTVEDDESQNYSVYKSFSVDESKYDSFDDSLNEGIDKMPQEAKRITLRKSYDKIKSKRSGFYDSLEDVCSLVSNIDKCSISCEVENESNLNSKHFVEDSLKILSVPVASKNNFISDQVHFDDDSLAILECETTFSDSLEEVNILESIEIEDINDIENISVENQNVLLTMDQHSTDPPKNLFDTSVEIVCEKKKDCEIADQEESFDEKNLLYDSLSNSDFKDILTDSLEESKQLKEMLSLSKHTTINITYNEENIIWSQNNELLNVEQNCSHPLPNLFDTSVQIISEKPKNNNFASPKEFLHNKNISHDSLSNSEIKDVSKDSLEESFKSMENLNLSEQSIGNNIAKSDDVFPNQNAFETSVQIVYDNLSNCFEKESTYVKTHNSEQNFENMKSFQENSEKIKIETGSEQSQSKSTCPQNPSKKFKNVDADKNILLPDSHINEDSKIKPNIPVISDSVIAVSANDILNSKKETFSVESCHLKVLSDDINIEKDLKFQLHIEVTVGDKKCQIASEDIKIVPISSHDCESEKNIVSTISVANPPSSSISNTTACTKTNEHEMLLSNTKLNFKNEDCNEFRSHHPSENSSSHKKSETVLESNITQRKKSSISQTSYTKLNFMDAFNDVSLLQALDLPDHSASFLGESVIQSKDSLIPLNLYSHDDCMQNFHTTQFKNKNKENIPEHVQVLDKNFCTKKENFSPNKMYNSKTAQSLQKCSSFKETYRKTPGTKIPVRKVDNFAIPTATPSKFIKPLPATLSAEKVKKCQHSPHSIDSCKRTPGTTPNKIPHICKVRNTIFSKVPQIIPSKKYMNVQSPVAQYIKNNSGSMKTSPVAQYIKNNSGPMKTSGVDPVLQDCMNHLMESPHHLHHTHTSGSLKSSKKKT